MMRVRVVGTGWAGAPSLSTFYFTSPTEDVTSAQEAVERVRAAHTGKNNLWGGVVTHLVDAAVDVITPSTGQITDTISVAPGASLVHTGSSGNLLPIASALLVNWRTDTFISGRRLRGRTFVSPTTLQSVEPDGSLADSARTLLEEYGDDLANAGGGDVLLVIWHRPTNGVGGSTGPVTSHTVPDKISVLRSRRD